MPRWSQTELDAFLARRAASRTGTPLNSDSTAPAGTRGELRESKIRADVIEYCRVRGWLVFSGTTAHATGRTVGEPDLTVAAHLGLVYFVELKSKTGKLRPEQAAVATWLERLGHKWLLVRSLKEFIAATEIEAP